ncbi:MAG: molybdenum cofactor biosynthesis protein F [Anaerolineales bacterium]|nr:MAG: molybdenum cofactor biosynthesis protein F [Anaerolineales bacterium]
MPKREGETDYKYEDYASELAAHRLPQTDALVNQTMKITLDTGTSFDLEFVDQNEVNWQSDNERGTDWCEVVEVAPQTYFIDMTFAHQPSQSQTFVVNTQSRQVLAIRTIMREGDVGQEPRAVHDFIHGVLGDPVIPPTGRKPAPTRDLIGLRGLYVYSPGQCFEHIYLNSKRYAWQCIVGPLHGESDVDMATVYKFDDNQYIFAFREFGLPVSTVFFYNWDQMRSTGKFFAIDENGAIDNTPAGALIKKLSMAFYPIDMQPL